MKNKTTSKQLAALKEAKVNSAHEYYQYLKEYNKERGIKGRTVIQEIIALHKEGRSKEEIVARGYNKWTVQEQIRLFSKGKRLTKTVVAKFLPPKDKSTTKLKKG